MTRETVSGTGDTARAGSLICGPATDLQLLVNQFKV